MLEIKKVRWSNFLSYGDYESEIDFTNLGECLITGKVIDEDSRESYDTSNPIQHHKSNGSGKSTISCVIQWILFGRTMHGPAPGDGVINWFTGKDCRGYLEFKNGDSITRTRNTNGHNELLFSRNGDEHKFTSTTASVAKNQQLQLAREFGLDWEVFCGSVFFNQYGKPWMGMADQYRKKAIERILHIDRFDYYAKISKNRHDAIELQVSTQRAKIEAHKNEITRLQDEVNRLTTESQNYATNQRQRQKNMLLEAVAEKKTRDAIILPDLEKLQSQWDIINKLNTKINEYRSKSNILASKLSELKGSVRSLTTRISQWTNKAGKICIECEQDINDTHTKSKINPLKQEIEKIQTKIIELESEKTKIDREIAAGDAAITNRKPNMTITAAKDVHKQWQRHTDHIERLTKNASSIGTEINPHEKSIIAAKTKLINVTEQIVVLEKQIERDDYLVKHYSYINRAYSDRNKIKSYVFQEHIPFINSRLKHYLDVFDLDVRIELTTSLGIQSNLWGYTFESGGERMRTDVAFMLAMFDFHEHMYGRQCNIIILDEVDGRLDDDGLSALVSVIKNDISPKAEAVLIISHKNQMFDTFPREIKVTRTNRFSQLAMI